MTREFASVELTGDVLLQLREAVRPLNLVTGIDPKDLIALCERIYYALLKQREERWPSVNMTLTYKDVLILNQFLSAEDGDWALDLLEQTWHVLYELKEERIYPRLEEEVELPWPVKVGNG